MLLTVTPNACVERTLRLDSFAVGHSHRIAGDAVREDAGGKGINAARVAQTLGASCTATGWIGRDREMWLRAQLERDNVTNEFIPIESPTRVSTDILSGTNPIVATEIVEAGNAVTLQEGTHLLHTFERLLPNARLCAISGSYPPAALGTQQAFEAFSSLLVRTAQRHRVPVILDGKGRAFEVALRSQPSPWCIKPNLDEARELLHREIPTVVDERRAILDLLHLGPQIVLLSCGARGCYVGMERTVWFLPSPAVTTISPVGSGDALVGAFAARYLAQVDVTEKERILEAARWGIAAGAANAARPDSGFVTEEEVSALVPQVRVQAQILALDSIL